MSILSDKSVFAPAVRKELLWAARLLLLLAAGLAGYLAWVLSLGERSSVAGRKRAVRPFFKPNGLIGSAFQ